MLRPTNSRRTNRRGNILIVTLALLALMAVVGITAVYFTKDQAERARIQGLPGPDTAFPDDGMAAWNLFLSTLIYDAPDYGSGLLNSMRGHSLSGTMYGRKAGANIAWNGPGTFGGSPTNAAFSGVTYRQLVNFRLFQGMPVVTDPEYSGPTAERAPSPTNLGLNPGTYYGKNPPYTYPDIKDFYLASMCPATGEILVPSFHRTNLFGSLDPSNPNWSSPQGRYLTLRPRPSDHANKFPPVPMNADGSYTGDVQNLPGGFGANGVAMNDSVWIDIGLPAFTLPNGRRVKPLVAPLILDLDGRMNLGIHGNQMNGGAHASGNGFGPWEINIQKALGLTEGPAMVAARGLPATRTALPGKAFYNRYTAVAPNNQIPQYAQVAWTGFTGPTPNPLQLPAFPPPAGALAFATSPTYQSGYSGANALVPNHPSLFNPNEWLNAAGPTAFTLSDTKIMTSRYAPYPFTTSQLSFGGTAPTTLRGSAAIPNPNPPASNTANGYRTDLAHTIRQLFTTHSYSRDLPGLMPGFVGGASQPQDLNAALGAIDLNRALAEYRNDTTNALSSGNVANQANADLERQQFAKDIFARLVAASANTADATVNPTTGVVTVFNAANVRPLAQLAVNIVDYIDNDDISTRFVWNAATDVVYGVEKPRLVLNEAYAEVTNDAADAAFSDNTKMAGMAPTDKAHVRFWLELQNPTSTPYTAPTGGPLGDGSVSFGALKPFKIEIVQNGKVGGTGVIGRLRQPTADPMYPANTIGDSGAAADITFDFSTATAGMTIKPANGVANAGMVVLAADVPPTPMDAAVAAAWLDYRYAPPGGAAADLQMIPGGAVGAANSLTYTIPLPTTGDDLQNTGTATGKSVSRHVVLLRRLANPYIAYDANLNPYITVDVLDHVRAADRLLLESGKKIAMKRSAAAGGAPPGFEANPQSIGKVQPYASYADPAVTTPTALAYPASMVLQQATGATPVQQTLGRQNSKAVGIPAAVTTPPGDTMVAPFDWLVHMDRPLINQIELLHVSTGKQFDLTSNFVGTGGTKFTGSAQTVLLAGTFPQLYRALDLLRVQPYGHQTAFGGRVPGRININTIQDKRVWDALFDAPAGGSGPPFDQNVVDNAWTTLMATRTTSMIMKSDATGTPPTWTTPVPGATIHDTGAAGGDRPFLPFGVATVPAGSGVTFTAGVGLDDTLLRRNPPATGVPYLSVTAGTHPYQQAEAVRKILNNTTTVSHTFAVWMTVGYFEVDPATETPTPVGGTFTQLGKEYYREAPGDTRKKFFALVDRSNIGIDPTTNAQPQFRPFSTTVEPSTTLPPGVTTLPAGTTTLPVSTGGGGMVYSDGVAVQIVAGTKLVVGVGASQEIVTVSAVGAEVNGVAPLTISATTKMHHAGEFVSNVMPGNPGPQSGVVPAAPFSFDVNSDWYKPVVPLWARLP